MQSNRKRLDKCSNETLAFLRAAWEGTRNGDSVASADPRVPMGSEWSYRWRFDLKNRVSWPLGGLQEFEVTRSKNASYWLFYKKDGSELASYKEGTQVLETMSSLEQLLDGSRITSLDRHEDTLVLGLDNGKVKLVTWPACPGVAPQSCCTIDLGPGPVLAVFAGLLPRFIVSYTGHQGLVCSNRHSGVSSTLVRAPRGDLQVALEFPRLTVFSETHLWHCQDVLREPLRELHPALRPQERLLTATPCADDSTLLLETDLRLLSLREDDCQTVFYKTAVCCQVSCAPNQVAVAEQYLYGISLTIYERPSDDDHRWVSLGYTDVQAKFDIHKVLQLALLSAGDAGSDPRTLALLTDDGSVQSFSMECS